MCSSRGGTIAPPLPRNVHCGAPPSESAHRSLYVVVPSEPPNTSRRSRTGSYTTPAERRANGPPPVAVSRLQPDAPESGSTDTSFESPAFVSPPNTIIRSRPGSRTAPCRLRLWTTSGTHLPSALESAGAWGAARDRAIAGGNRAAQASAATAKPVRRGGRDGVQCTGTLRKRGSRIEGVAFRPPTARCARGGVPVAAVYAATTPPRKRKQADDRASAA